MRSADAVLDQSRYTTTSVIRRSRGNVSRLERTRREFVAEADIQGTEVYVISKGDRIDNLAADFLGDVRLWWVIADVNPVAIPDPLKLVPGTHIRIPSEATVAVAGGGLP